MAITEDKRHDLFEALVEVLGREKATTLMEHLPPVGWADVATKRDLDHQSTVTRHDVEVEAARLRSEMQTGFADVRSEMHTGFAEMRGEIAAIEIRFERGLREQSRTFFLGMLAANTTLAGLAFTAAHLA